MCAAIAHIIGILVPDTNRPGDVTREISDRGSHATPRLTRLGFGLGAAVVP